MMGDNINKGKVEKKNHCNPKVISRAGFKSYHLGGADI